MTVDLASDRAISIVGSADTDLRDAIRLIVIAAPAAETLQIATFTGIAGNPRIALIALIVIAAGIRPQPNDQQQNSQEIHYLFHVFLIGGLTSP